MQLHEFMSDHREEILEVCHEALRAEQHGPDANEHIRAFFDEMLRAMRRESGIRDSVSPLPASSETAAKLGTEHHRAGLSISIVPRIFGAISQAIARTGERYEICLAAEEYALLNRCLDVGIAISIENYWRRERSEVERAAEIHGHLAHELRNALGNANMAFKLLRVGNLGLHGSTADVLARNLQRMGMLVAQSLAAARADAGKEPVLEPLNVASVLRDVEAAALPQRGISIVLEADELLYIAGDEMLLASAVGNLVHNAIKFSPDGGTVRLSVRADNEHVVVRVDDQCGGIGDVTLDQLCKPYVSLRKGQQGMGLGLAITKSAVEAMHGEVQVENRPGVGCTFALRFPLFLAS